MDLDQPVWWPGSLVGSRLALLESSNCQSLSVGLRAGVTGENLTGPAAGVAPVRKSSGVRAVRGRLPNMGRAGLGDWETTSQVRFRKNKL